MNAIRRATSVITRQRNIAVRLLASEAGASHGHGVIDYGGGHGKSLAETLKEHRGTLNDLPIPAGSWEEHHKKKNAGYNIILALGVVSLVTTFLIMKSTGALYLHGRPNLKKVEINLD